MKQFILQLVCFAVLASGAVYLFGEVSYAVIMKTGNNFLNNADFKVTKAIRTSKQKKKTSKLIIGDSVGEQLYGSCNDETVVGMTATVALTTVGQYCLLANYFKNNAGSLPEEVILIYNPLCMNNVLSGGLVYATFAKNMYNDEFKLFLDKETIQYLDKWPYAWLLNQKWFRLCPFIPDFNSTMEHGEWISPVQYKYIIKMKSLCENNSVKFRIIAPPLRQSLEKNLIQVIKKDSHSSEQLFQEYITSITFLPDYMYADQLHFKPQYIPKDYFHLHE